MLSNESQHASTTFLPPIIPLSLSLFFSCLSLHLPCVSQPGPSRGIGIPALMQAALGSAADKRAHTHACTSVRARENYNSLKSSSLTSLQNLYPSVLSPVPFSCPRTRLTVTGLHFNFLLILNFEWYKLFSAIKAPKFKAIIAILNPLGSLFSN